METYEADADSGSADYTITLAECDNVNRPINYGGVKNYTEVPYVEFLPEDEAGEVYLTDDIAVSGLTTNVTIDYGSDVVLEGDATATEETGVTVSLSSTYHPWGVDIVATRQSGTTGTFKVKVTGKKILLTAVGKETDSDPDSIALYGKSIYTLPQNFLVQSSSIAQEMATALLYYMKDPRADITVDISANPASEIGDIVEVDVYSKGSVTADFRIISQQFKLGNGFRCNLKGKRLINFS